MDRFFTLLREGKFKVIYDSNPPSQHWVEVDEEWSNDELCQHIRVLKCSGYNLTRLPPLPNAERVDCYDNELEEIPDLPKAVVVNCGKNRLSRLSALPLVEVLLCYDNVLEDLPVNMLNLTALSCHNNKLTVLRCDHRLKWLDGRNNPWKYHMKIPSHPRIMCRGMIFTHLSIGEKMRDDKKE